MSLTVLRPGALTAGRAMMPLLKRGVCRCCRLRILKEDKHVFA
jgi:hypothetical protein